MPRRIVVRIEISPAAKAKLTEVRKQNGMTQVAVMSRLIEWFAAQAPQIQSAIMGHYPSDIQAEVAKLILNKMAAAESK
jgi:hypothetical protein